MPERSHVVTAAAATPVSAEPVLQVRGLSVGYHQQHGDVVQVVRDVDLDLNPGEILGLAGESGCGKSTVSLALMGFRGRGLAILSGRSELQGRDLLQLSVEERRRLWGQDICHVSQNAGTALNPSFTVARQLAEPLTGRMGLRGEQVLQRQLELLAQVRLPAGEKLLRRYPHQLSGGQQQRVAIALALATAPSVLLLDEPTTGLDPTTQSQISALLRDLVQRHSMAALYVSHDLSLLSGAADRLAVMYAGEIVEQAPLPVRRNLAAHPYTRALMAALPNSRVPLVISGIAGSPPPSATHDGCGFAARCPHVLPVCRETRVSLSNLGHDHEARCLRVGDLPAAPLPAQRPRGAEAFDDLLLEASGLTVRYRGADHDSLQDVSIRLARGETLGVLGESGSGKSTLLRCLSGLHPPVAGELRLAGKRLDPRIARRGADQRRALQIVFQNPDSALNPRHSVQRLIARPVKLFRGDLSRAAQADVVAELVDAVKLPRSVLDRYPAELSGGQKQRVALARAFATRPDVLLCDEVTSALDVSVQATVVELIGDLAREFGTAVVFVSHDLGLVRSICNRVMVMRHGRVCEQGVSEDVFDRPSAAYTRELMEAIPAIS